MLMRSLTETDAIKVISWNSTNKLLRDNGVPQRFHCYTTTIRVVQELEEDADCTTVKAREEKFAKLTKQSRATYHNIKKALKQNGQLQPITPETVPCIPLKGKEPPKVDLEALEAENQPDAVGEGDDEGGADCEQRAG
jgi:hypothetical protein